MSGGSLTWPLLLPLYYHQAKLSVVQLVVSTRVKLWESNGHLQSSAIIFSEHFQPHDLILCQVLADVMKFCLRHKPVSVFVHALKDLLDVRFFPEELFKTQSLVKVSVHVIEKLLHLLPGKHKQFTEQLCWIIFTLTLGLQTGSRPVNSRGLRVRMVSNKDSDVQQLLDSCVTLTWCHSSLVSFPSPFLSALLKYLLTCTHSQTVFQPRCWHFLTSTRLLSSAFSPPSPRMRNFDILVT